MVLQELLRLSAEANQLRAAVEEARGAAEESRKGRLALRVRRLAGPDPQPALTVHSTLTHTTHAPALWLNAWETRQACSVKSAVYLVELRVGAFVSLLLLPLQSQLDEAASSIQQLQAALSRTATGAAGERELVADMMKRLELRTAERNEAMAATSAAEGRIRVSQSQY